MKLILKETIEALGIIGDEVTVANGYARNYLLPQSKAILFTPQNRKMMEQNKSKVDFQIAKEKKLAEAMAQNLENVKCKITAKVIEEGRLYGSVTSRDIFDALTKQNVEIGKNMILLKEPIKQIGSYKIPIRIYKDVEPNITVEVLSA